MQPTTSPASTIVDPGHIKRTNKLKLVWGIICLVAPTALIIISFIGYMILNFISGAGLDGVSPITGKPSASNIGITIGNTFLFAVSAISMITWLPGIVVGIVLLATRRRI